MATGAGGIEVGRASLRVVPNFDGFLTKARKGLQQAEKRLQARVKLDPYMKGFTDDARKLIEAAEKNLNAKVRVDLDDRTKDKFKEIDRYIDKIRKTITIDIDDAKAKRDLAKLLALVEKVDKLDPDINIDADTREAVLKLKKFNEDSKRILDDLNVDVDADTAKATKRVKEFDSILKTFPREFHIDVVAETARARKKLDKFKAQYEASLAKLDANVFLDARAANEKAKALRVQLTQTLKDINADIDLDDKKARAKMAKLLKQMEKEIDVLVKVDQTSYMSTWAKLKALPRKIITRVEVLSDTKHIERMQGILRSFARLTATASAGFIKLGSAVAVVGIAAGKIIPMLTALGGELISVSASALKVAGSFSVPAIMSAATAYGALKSALFGFGDVWSAENWEDLNTAIEDMTWKAQQGAISLYELKKSFDFRDIQDTFWRQFDNLDQITNTLLPDLQKAVDHVAYSFGLAASNLTSFMTEEAGLAATKTLIEGSSVAGETLAHTIGAVARGIIAVGAAATPIFNKMVGKIRNVADAWANDMVGAFQDGTLEESLRGHVQKLGEFSRGVARFGGDIAGVFKGISKAASEVPHNGGNTILMWLSQLNAWVNSFEGQNALYRFFDSTGIIASSVAPILASLGRTVMQDVYPAFAGFISELAPGMRTFFENLPKWIQPVLDRMPQLGTAISDVLGNLDLEGIGQTIGNIFGFVSTTVLPILEVIAPHLDTIVNTIVPLSAAILTVVEAVKIWTAVQKILNMQLAYNPIGATVIAITALVTWLVTAYNTSDDFRNAVNTAFQAVSDFIGNAVEWIGEKFEKLKEGFGKVGDFFQGVGDKLGRIFGKNKDDASDMEMGVSKSFEETKYAASISSDEMQKNVNTRFEEMKNAVKDKALNLKNSVATRFSELNQAAIDKVSSIKNNFTEKFNFIKNFIPALVGEMKRRVEHHVGQLKWKIDSYIFAIKTIFQNGFQFIKDWASNKASEMLGNVTRSLSGLKDAARDKIQGMVNSFQNGFNDAVNRAKNFGRNFVTSIMNGIGNLYNSGKSVLDSFISGLTAGFDKARNAVSNGIQSVRDFFPFSPAKEGPFSGKGWVTYSGLSIGPAFAKGIEKGMKSAVSAAETLTDKTSKALDADTPTIDLDTVAYVKQLRLMESEIMRFADTFEDSMTRSSDSIVDSLRGVNLEMKKLPESPGVRYSAHMDSLEPVASSPVSQDFSIHISTMEVKNERDAKRLLEDLQKKQKIKAGI